MSKFAKGDRVRVASDVLSSLIVRECKRLAGAIGIVERSYTRMGSDDVTVVVQWHSEKTMRTKGQPEHWNPAKLEAA
jgi:hypothetical protein